MHTYKFGSVGIMQPYFFPYWGHFSLIFHSKNWLIFDDCKYRPKSWINRNRILHPQQGWQYITVPIANSSRSIKISDVLILDPQQCLTQMINKLFHYKKRAPYYTEVISLIERAFTFVDSSNTLVSLCHGSLQVMCDYLEIPYLAKRTSELNLNYPEDLFGGKWAPFICNQIGASAYMNPKSGEHLFDADDFRSLNISFSTLAPVEFKYSQGTFSHTPNLSIIDTAMWLNPKIIRNAIEHNVIISRKA